MYFLKRICNNNKIFVTNNLSMIYMRIIMCLFFKFHIHTLIKLTLY